MNKIEFLTASDFPGVDEEKFEEWKELSLRLNKAHLLGTAVFFGTGLITVLLIGGAIGWFLPIIVWWGYMFLYPMPLATKQKKLTRELGIDRKKLRQALKEK